MLKKKESAAHGPALTDGKYLIMRHREQNMDDIRNVINKYAERTCTAVRLITRREHMQQLQPHSD